VSYRCCAYCKPENMTMSTVFSISFNQPTFGPGVNRRYEFYQCSFVWKLVKLVHIYNCTNLLIVTWHTSLRGFAYHLDLWSLIKRLTEKQLQNWTWLLCSKSVSSFRNKLVGGVKQHDMKAFKPATFVKLHFYQLVSKLFIINKFDVRSGQILYQNYTQTFYPYPNPYN